LNRGQDRPCRTWVPRRGRAGLIAALWAAGAILAAPPVPAAPSPAQLEPLDLGRWFSRMWRPVASFGGPLSDDTREDAVIVLHRRDAVPEDQLPVGSRGLAIFSLGADGVYRREALAEGLLPCVQCLGTISRDPDAVPFEIDIEDRQLALSWIGNTDGFVFVRLVFAWDPHERAFGLVSDELVRANRLSGIKSRRLRDYRAGRAVTDGEVSAFAPRFIPIDQVKADDYR
jgi:hypothetical protein